MSDVFYLVDYGLDDPLRIVLIDCFVINNMLQCEYGYFVV